MNTPPLEVAGIEPASSGFSVGLLRAQPAVIVGTGAATGDNTGPYPTEVSLTAGRHSCSGKSH